MAWVLSTIRDLVTELENVNEPNARDIELCGTGVASDLRRCAKDLRDARDHTITRSRLDELIETAHRMLVFESPNNYCWRRLYTDSCLLRSLSDVQGLRINEQLAINSVSRLDRVIIVCGAPGLCRLDLVNDIIEKVQDDHLKKRVSQILPSHTAHSSPLHPVTLNTASQSVPCIDPPSLHAFRDHFSKRPFVLRNYAQDWPALQNHPWASKEYLQSVAGPGRIVPVEVGSDYRTDDWSQKLMGWDDFLFSLSERSTEVLYLAQHNLFAQFPALRLDIEIPDYVFTALPQSSDFPNYEPPQNDDQYISNVWLGPKGTISPAHTDPFYNFYAQVVGRKTIWLAPPSSTPFMDPFTFPEDAQSQNPASYTSNPMMSNTSRVDVFPISIQRHEYGYAHPDFWKNVVPEAMCTTLGPGDVLFFPPGWWHAMRSEEISFSVSVWF